MQTLLMRWVRLSALRKSCTGLMMRLHTIHRPRHRSLRFMECFLLEARFRGGAIDGPLNNHFLAVRSGASIGDDAL